jgi:hypothetical protein
VGVIFDFVTWGLVGCDLRIETVQSKAQRVGKKEKGKGVFEPGAPHLMFLTAEAKMFKLQEKIASNK